MLKNVVGLFGTCGNSKWREDIAIPMLEEAGIEYFNPVVPDWNEEAMKNEVDHAATDKVILLVITGETTGIASMAESGWIALNAKVNDQNLIIVIEDMPSDHPDAVSINKTRKLLRKYIKELWNLMPISYANNVKVGVNLAVEIMQMSIDADNL